MQNIKVKQYISKFCCLKCKKKIANKQTVKLSQEHVNDFLFVKILDIWIDVCEHLVNKNFKASWIDKSIVGQDKIEFEFHSKKSPLTVSIRLDLDNFNHVDQKDIQKIFLQYLSENIVGEVDELIIREAEQQSFVFEYGLSNAMILSTFHDDERYLNELAQILYLKNKNININHHLSSNKSLEFISVNEQKQIVTAWKRILLTQQVKSLSFEDQWLRNFDGNHIVFISISFTSTNSIKDDIFRFKIFKDDIENNDFDMCKMLCSKVKETCKHDISIH
ncbi:MAG: hypothetical protein N4Q07_00930 [Lactobacillus iners]|uniref:hypothetical protein n=1 Tax=Lactobacillus iners TaxID=147802 RepID=UPI000C7F8B62|nr:hypothetical protein [Lactobacillus iners]MCT7782877.1 hypothetical protein [Lactobacillus iners]MCT7865117.1 hypothetical protein [Lactobacillus iners]MDK7317698.1 hypothetical protein [Lactobacillus iners]PMC41321.1 hypothetical protein CJ223_06435 [Lactobacillus iners]